MFEQLFGALVFIIAFLCLILILSMAASCLDKWQRREYRFRRVLPLPRPMATMKPRPRAK